MNPNSLKNFCFIFLCLFFFAGCKKKMFKNVKAYGRVVNYYTKEPVSTAIDLYGGDSYSQETTYFLDGGITSSDGKFSFKSKAVKAEKYWIIVGNSITDRMNVQLKEGEDVDLGDIPSGKYTFYAKVTLVPVSNSDVDFPFLSEGTKHFSAGTSTQFITSRNADRLEYEGSGHTFQVIFRTYSFPGGPHKDSLVSVPIPYPPDTIPITINY